ncbi:MAG: tRNA (adenosine(37)-N6)-threonylcarbamoyltransferase complex ATPase subunit type 1 TsaE [Canibacter sp.]
MTESTRFTITDPDEMHALGQQLGAQLRAGDLVLLTGPLGAGKTTLTRGIGDGLNVRGPVTSPTFVLARTHPSLDDGPSLVHVDAYRLADSTELDDLDLDFNSSVVVAEWGDGLIDAGDSWLHLVIARPEGDIVDADDVTDAEQHWDEEPIEPRLVTITRHGARWTDLEILLPGEHT